MLNRILLVRTDRLGDVLLTLPMLPALHRCFPHARISMLLRRYTGAVTEGNSNIHELVWYDDENGLIPLSRMRKTLRNGRFDAVIVVYPTFRLAWLMFMSGIPVRVGTGYRWYSFLFNKKVYEHRKDARRHEVEYNLNLLSQLGCRDSERPEFSVTIPGAARARIQELLTRTGMDTSKGIVVIHPGSGGSAREWKPENFGELARRLSEDGSMACVVTGTAAEAAKTERVAAASNGTARSLAGTLSIHELGALLERSILFVSNSTGPIHLAAALGTPVVGLYPWQKAMSAARWGPYTDRKVVLTPAVPGDCSECDGQSTCACMETITVDEVYRAARSLLDRRPAPERRVGMHDTH